MKGHVQIWLLLLVVWGLSACQYVQGGNTVRGSGDVVEETRDVTGFDRVELGTIGTLIIEKGDQISLDVEPGASITPTRPIRYLLTTDDLREITLSSSGDAQAPMLQASQFAIHISSSGGLTMDGIEADRVDITVSSSGKVRLDEIVTGRLSVDIESSGNVTIGSGSADEQDIRISSSGDYEARDVQSTRTEVRLTSSGSATVRVSEVLNGRLSSSGNLYYVGNPQVDVETTSSGDVEQVGR